MKIYVSMSTIPSKIGRIKECVATLINQTVKPTKIFINIPKKYSLRFDNAVIKDEDIPKFISPLVEIIRCEEDYGPGTKIMGNLDFLKKQKDAIVIIVDDDIHYSKDLIEIATRYLSRKKNVVVTRDLYNYAGRNMLGMWSGNAMCTNYLDYLDYFYQQIKHNKQILYHDDFWFAYYLYYRGIREFIHVRPAGHYDIFRTSDDLCNVAKGTKYHRDTVSVVAARVLNSPAFAQKMEIIPKLNTVTKVTIVSKTAYKTTNGKTLCMIK